MLINSVKITENSVLNTFHNILAHVHKHTHKNNRRDLPRIREVLWNF